MLTMCKDCSETYSVKDIKNSRCESCNREKERMEGNKKFIKWNEVSFDLGWDDLEEGKSYNMKFISGNPVRLSFTNSRDRRVIILVDRDDNPIIYTRGAKFREVGPIKYFVPYEVRFTETFNIATEKAFKIIMQIKANKGDCNGVPCHKCLLFATVFCPITINDHPARSNRFEKLKLLRFT